MPLVSLPQYLLVFLKPGSHQTTHLTWYLQVFITHQGHIIVIIRVLSSTLPTGLVSPGLPHTQGSHQTNHLTWYLQAFLTHQGYIRVILRVLSSTLPTGLVSPGLPLTPGSHQTNHLAWYLQAILTHHNHIRVILRVLSAMSIWLCWSCSHTRVTSDHSPGSVSDWLVDSAKCPLHLSVTNYGPAVLTSACSFLPSPNICTCCKQSLAVLFNIKMCKNRTRV